MLGGTLRAAKPHETCLLVALTSPQGARLAAAVYGLHMSYAKLRICLIKLVTLRVTQHYN